MAKAVTINSIEKIMKENYKDKNTVEWNGISIEIKRSLDLVEMYSFVKDVVKGCFSDDGEYYPEMKEFAIKQHMIMSYTNVRLPEDVAKRYRIIMRSGILEFITQWIDMDQYEDIRASIDRRINIAVESSISTAIREMKKVGDSLNDIVESFGELFNGVSADDIKKLSNAISVSGIDYEKIMSSYLANKGLSGNNVSSV